ncbi:MAG: molybdenum ABC transporter permease subunit [Chloroflexi bacterium RBG_19FT_COMBO_62_14]|nr:MAG: molybdenum ABC transporter permease subunit [Chloroflexi bacterium RBG_19FT_COMBO_62_14]
MSPRLRTDGAVGRRWDRWTLLGLPLLVFLALPVVGLLIRSSPTALVANLARPDVGKAIAVSLKTTLVSIMVIVAFGTPLAYMLGFRNFKGKRLVETLVDLPTVLPPSVAGVALLVAFGRRGLLGGALEDLGLEIAFSQAAVVMAQSFVAAPFYVRTAALGFGAVDKELIQAAMLDGAGSWKLFREVVLPLAFPSALSGAVMSWARALGEFGATIIFAGNFPGRTQTMPLAIYIGFEVDLNTALTLSVILILLSFASLWLIRASLGRDAPEAQASR